MWYDILVLAILIYFTVRGAAKGMVWQLAGIAGIVICFLFADGISAAAGPYVSLEPPLNNWVILFGAYVVFTLISYLIAGQITEYLAKLKLKEFDKHLGAVFGFTKGVILCLIITFLAVTMSEDAREALKNSRSGVAAARIVKTVHPYLNILPQNLVEALEKYIHLLDDEDLEEQYANDHDHYSELNNNHGANEEILPPQQSNTTLLTQLTQLLSDKRTEQAILSAVQSEENPQTQNTILQRLVNDFEKTPPSDRAKIEEYFQGLAYEQGSQVLLSALKSTLGVTETPNAVPNPDPVIPISPTTSVTPNDPVAVRKEIDSIRKQIVSAYTADPGARLEFEKQIENYLGMLPENVYLGVLQDWNADIWSLPDPDQKTSGQSTLEERIIRQLTIAGIPISTLKPEMQQRLKAAGNPNAGAMR